MVLNVPVPEICSWTVKGAHGQPRHRHGCRRNLYGCPRTLHSSYTDHPGCCHLLGLIRINFPKLSCLLPGSPRTIPICPRPTRIDTKLHGCYTVYMPDRAGYEPW
ncbi:hypothetical protein DPMN_117374 [Dreissena polymorpha]|uniref:Uncharacterized protein n=1 Tax=Dreissena polymorpha TaxID=45954 RepID=A0A9D4KQH6_DREPO|nr:hypothetical protein DPMN_117374 [Dreissena polymorpha]